MLRRAMMSAMRSESSTRIAGISDSVGTRSIVGFS